MRRKEGRPKGEEAVGHGMAIGATGERVTKLLSNPSSVPAARHLIRDDLAARGLSPRVVEDALVVVTELMGNAVRHARPLDTSSPSGTVRLRWMVTDGSVRIHVTDGGGTERPHVEHHSLVDTGGRGLAIVSALASDWGVVVTDEDVTVYAVVDQAP